MIPELRQVTLVSDVMTFIVWLKRLPQELESSLRLVRSSCDCTPIGATSQTARLAGSKPWLLLLALHKWCVVVQNCHLYQKLDFSLRHSELKVSLDYMRPCLEDEKNKR